MRPGLAEVIYTKREQALQAITTYHDRELDGQPMQCKLDTSTVPETVQQQPIAKPKTTGLVTAATVAAASVTAQQKPTSLSDRFKLVYIMVVNMIMGLVYPPRYLWVALWDPLTELQHRYFRTGVAAE